MANFVSIRLYLKFTCKDWVEQKAQFICNDRVLCVFLYSYTIMIIYDRVHVVQSVYVYENKAHIEILSCTFAHNSMRLLY